MERYLYNDRNAGIDGQFRKEVGNNFEEWQNGKQLYRFRATGGSLDRRWIFLYDNTSPRPRNISIKLPYNGGQSYIKWNGKWDDNSIPWQNWHQMTVLRKFPEPMYHVNSMQANPVGQFSGNSVQQLKKTSAVLQVEFQKDKWHCFASGTLIHPFVVLTTAHPIENLQLTYPNISDSNFAVTFNYEYTAQSLGTSNPTLSPNRPWARVRKVIETGSQLGIDYALLLIRWVSPSVSNVPSIETIRPCIGKHVLAIQNPKYKEIESISYNGKDAMLFQNPTQVSAGDVYDLYQAPFDYHGDNVCAFATFTADRGSSGGGVFSRNQRLIGIIGGGNQEGDSFFIQMDKIIEKSLRLQQYCNINTLIPWRHVRLVKS